MAPAHGLGGMQGTAMDLARGMVSRGHDVTMLTTGHPDRGAHRELYEGVDIRYLPCPAGEYTPAWYAELERAFTMLHAQDPFDLLHSHSTAALRLDPSAASPVTPGVVTFYGEAIGELRTITRISLHPLHPRGSMLGARAIAQILWKDFGAERLPLALRPWRVVATSPAMAGRLQRWYRVSPARLTFIPQGVDTRQYTPVDDAGRERELARLNVAPGAPVLLAAGRMEREKGFDLVLRAHRRVMRAHPGACLLLAGDGGERFKLESLSRTLGSSSHVRFLGALDPASLRGAYRAADVLMHLTRREEGIPNVVLEAMACGTPVVGTRHGGMRHALGGGTGVVVGHPIVASSASAVTALLGDRGRLAELGARVRARAEREFDSAHIVGRVEEIYEALV